MYSTPVPLTSPNNGLTLFLFIEKSRTRCERRVEKEKLPLPRVFRVRVPQHPRRHPGGQETRGENGALRVRHHRDRALLELPSRHGYVLGFLKSGDTLFYL